MERLANSGLITKKDVILDYGCGKGRVGFFLGYQARAKSIGVEYDKRIYDKALENRETAASSAKTEFVLSRAEEYEVPKDVTGCYFFNPFSVEILHKVMAKIIGSYYENPRAVQLFFYYPSDEYISCLMSVSELEFSGDIDVRDLFDGKNPMERIAVFRLPGF